MLQRRHLYCILTPFKGLVILDVLLEILTTGWQAVPLTGRVKGCVKTAVVSSLTSCRHASV